MIDAQSIAKHYKTRSDELVVLRDVSLKVGRGESVAIMGPSGSGKSTLLNILGTLDRPSTGDVTINGLRPFDLPERALARFRNRTIGFVFQDHHLLPQCSVIENVLLPTLADRTATDARDRAKALLHRVGLSQRVDHLPSELSGGEKQRVAIARALIRRPAVILADEPTGNLDRNAADVVADLLTELCGDEESCLVMVTHSESLAKHADRTFELVDGRLESA